VSNTAGSISLSNAVIPAASNCTISIGVSSAMAGSYSVALDANALTTGPAGGNSVASTPVVLDVTAPSSGSAGVSSGGGGGGGGSVDWLDAMFAVGVLLAGRRRISRQSPYRDQAPRR
jgi:hypothetical protein